MYGKSIRMERITDRKTGNAVIVPMDHGVSVGPLDGLIDMRKTVDEVSNGGATAVLMHKGLIRYSYRQSGRDVGLIMHLSASTDLGPNRNSKVQITTIEEAIKYGADAVSIHINFGSEDEPSMLEQAGKISEQCTDWGMPLIIMAYPRGPEIKNSFDPEAIAHCARAASEIGADLVKVSYTGDIDTFRDVCKGALAPVLIAGGPQMGSDLEILNMVHDSMEAGGRGVSIGRNVFQNRNVRGITKAISSIVLDGFSVEEASKFL
ncbi:MAG: 2-amino-3,7-dideoxy-D-threo-hept-6-ulosonate synthase [Candidatus Methanomethylophilaceae archaeon]|nr:class I fructose-bisphosphate aldolase family protein [Candidatus Methanomethylophilaceae archaeon]MBR2092438.1 2-amino-3,7-dideoxy-D-threo-hept-6-ulosonate synthase [Candidatus Methanomethylophilaceae archaeon]MBR3476096.1 2-amino-3,7-dideoxy-D-threo-hept-6-ulosonate synthase [Candidatus Methanomethylophilaceae archaeon]MBR4180729.1 2-amino-3,7-dideoxy-D-threo-hept-6-ulosonate synthase [Candidatus Methanomethylophilaceae archaeon]MBR6871802.1 2-amino-3,7-dideoxy-D-threo-hept-6-ulosonate syn